MLTLLDFVAFDWVSPHSFVPATIANIYTSDVVEQIVRFEDDGQVVGPMADQAGPEVIAGPWFDVPYFDGMTELVVERASVTFAGRYRDQLATLTTKSGSGSKVTVPGAAGSLRRIEIDGLAVVDVNQAVSLVAGGSRGYRWTTDGSRTTGVENADHKLHLVVMVDRGDGRFGPPAAAAPHYDMPDDNANLYGPALAGATIQVDHPRVGTVAVTFDPMISSERAQLLLGSNRSTSAHAGLPTDVEGVAWTADAIRGVWASVPTDMTLTATLGDRSVSVADLPGPLPTASSTIDLTPAARSLLGDAYQQANAQDDFRLAVVPTSTTAGDAAISATNLVAHYRLDATPGDGLAVSLQGAPVTVEVPVGLNLRAAQFVTTIDGRFGPDVLLASSDAGSSGSGPVTGGGPLAGPRNGFRLTTTDLAARRLTVATDERPRPLTRLSVFGRSPGRAEVVVTLQRDRHGRPGASVGEPVALTIEPSATPAWHRLDLPKQTEPIVAEAIWVMLTPSTGQFWWYQGDEAVTSEPVSLLSTDGGLTWATGPATPLTQAHYASERPVPAALRLETPLGTVADLLDLPAARTRIETTYLDALTGETVGGADPQPMVTVTGTAPTSTSVTFRKEIVEPLADLTGLADLGGHLPMTFSSARDVDLRVLDTTIRYDPWTARP